MNKPWQFFNLRVDIEIKIIHVVLDTFFFPLFQNIKRKNVFLISLQIHLSCYQFHNSNNSDASLSCVSVNNENKKTMMLL